MNEAITPTTVAAPAASYALAVRTTAAASWLHTSGVLGTRPDGTIASDLAGQAAEMWRTVGELLGASGFTVGDIVSYTTYVVAGQDLGPVMAARDTFLAGHLACSTLVTVPALARPEWLVEVAVVAAR